MKLVYIAGPYRPGRGKTTEQNIDIARKRAIQSIVTMMKHNWFPVTPHMNTARFEEEPELASVTDEYYLAGTAEQLKRCDALLLTFERADQVSAGTAAEVRLAEQLGIPVYRSIYDFITQEGRS